MKFTFCFLFLLCFYAHSHSLICRSYFEDPANLVNQMASYLRVKPEKTAYFQLTQQQRRAILSSSNTKAAHTEIMRILWNDANKQLDNLSMEDLNDYMLDFIVKDLSSQNVQFSIIEEPVFFYDLDGSRRFSKFKIIKIHPSRRSAINRFADDIKDKYSKDAFISPFIIYHKNIFALVTDKVMYMPIEAVYDFTVKDEYIFHEVVHMMHDRDYANFVSGRAIIFPNKKDTLGLVKPIELGRKGYEKGYRFDELEAYERGLIVSLQSVINRMAAGKDYAFQLERFISSVTYFLDLSSHVDGLLSQAIYAGFNNNSFVFKPNERSVDVYVQVPAADANILLESVVYFGSRESVSSNRIAYEAIRRLTAMQKESAQAKMLASYIALATESAFRMPVHRLHESLIAIKKELKAYSRSLRSLETIKPEISVDYKDQSISSTRFDHP